MTKQIPTGYKQTKVGIIPEEWEMLTINQLVNMDYLYKPLDGNHGDIHPKSSDFVPSGIPFIMANNIKNGVLDLKKCSFIAKNQADKLQKGFSIIGDVLLTHKGTVGNVVMVNNLDTDYIMLTPQVTYYRVKDHSQLSNHYIFQYFLSKIFQQKLEEIAGGGTRAYIGITEQRNLPFILPPIKEQEKIAEILSTWDDAIAKQEQLIKQKQVFKKGIMQQIFSQKTCFKDDNGNDYPTWQPKKLGDIGEIIGGGTPDTLNDNFWNGTINWFTPTEIKAKYVQKSKRTISRKGLENSSAKILPAGTILVTTRATIGDVAISLSECTTNQGFQSIIVNDKNSNEFVYHLLSVNKNKLLEKASGSTFPEISRSELLKLYFKMPSLTEQTKIAAFLTSIDDERNKQTDLLDQLKLQKQSLMQKLLTGQVRTLRGSKEKA